MKTLISNTVGLFLILATAPLHAQTPTPAAPQTTPIVIKNATIHTVTGDVIENGQLVFEKGKISAVGINVAVPENAEEISAEGKHVYPGMFEAHSHIGLTEISSVAATIDHTETGTLNPNAKAQVAINPDSELIAVTRSGGVLIALAAPSGGLISGRSTVIQLDGWTYEDMTVKDEAALHITWPTNSPSRRRRGPQNPDDTAVKPEANIKLLRDLFEQARHYQKLKADPASNQALDLRLESLGDVVSGNVPLLIRADQIVDIQSAVSFAVEQNVKLIILGGYDAPLCADLLKKHDVPVIVSAVYRNPIRRGDPDDYAYSLPRRLHEAGIRFCISCTDRSESWNTRNLPFHAGTAVAFGLPYEEALKAVTLYPAEILNVADRVGSIEVGKDATVIITDGDPLDTRSKIEGAFVQGRAIDLSNRQTRLYEKYKQKYTQPGHLPPEK